MKDRSNHCLNCDHLLKPDDNYCSNCGQKGEFQNLSIRHLFASFLDAFLYFDKKLLSSLKDIWIGNRIVRDFVSGKRSRYVHPFRLLFIMLVIFFTLVALAMKNFSFNQNTSLEKKLAVYDVYKDLLAFRDSLGRSPDTLLVDSIAHNIFANQTNYARDTFISGRIMGTNFRELGITTEDVFTLSEDSLYAKYKIEKWRDRLVLNQTKRVVLNLEESIRFVIANMLWGIILLTVFMGAFLQLLYIRHNVFYVENYVITVIFHTQILILTSVLLLIHLLITPIGITVLLFVNLIPGILLFINLKNYYGQGWIKTFVKMFLLHGFYYVMLSFVIIIIAIISLLFY